MEEGCQHLRTSTTTGKTTVFQEKGRPLWEVASLQPHRSPKATWIRWTKQYVVSHCPLFSLAKCLQDILKKRAGLATLGEWTHIDCLRRVAHGEIQDGILRRLLHHAIPTNGDELDLEEDAAGSRLEKLLAASDLDNVMAIDEPSPSRVHDVPGGTVSFLFEKISNPNLDSGVDLDDNQVL